MRGCRVAWYTDDDVAPVTDETRRAVARAASALSDAGLIAEQRRPPGLNVGTNYGLSCFRGPLWYSFAMFTKDGRMRVGTLSVGAWQLPMTYSRSDA